MTNTQIRNQDFDQVVDAMLAPVKENDLFSNDVLDNDAVIDYLTNLGGQSYVDQWNAWLAQHDLISRTNANSNYVYAINATTNVHPLSNQAVYDAIKR